MKCFNISFKILDVNIDNSSTPSLIPEELFEEWEKGDSFLREFRKKAALKVQNIRDKRKEILNDTYNKCENYRQEKYQNIDKEIADKKDEAVREIITWLKEAKQLETETYQCILDKAKQALSDSLKDIYSKIPWSKLLGEALQNYMLGQKTDTIGHVLVNKYDYEELKKSLDSYPNLKFEISESLKKGSARLETDYFTIVVEIPRQIETLRQALTT